MKWGAPAVGAVIVVVVAGAAFAIHGLQPPSASAIAEGNAFTQANNKMMTDMMGNTVVYSGNVDSDFVMLMLPHHQGAIDMAAVELKYGTDPAVLALAKAHSGGTTATNRPNDRVAESTRGFGCICWRHGHGGNGSGRVYGGE